MTAEVVEKEIAEANDLSVDAMDAAARKLASSDRRGGSYPGGRGDDDSDVFCDTDSEHDYS